MAQSSLPPRDIARLSEMLGAVEKMRQAQNNPAVSEQRQEIYRAIGEAITEWSSVEEKLAILHAYFVAGTASAVRRARPAMAAFHAVINFNSKLGMVHQAALWCLSGGHLDNWRTLHNRAARQAKGRNDIAHFPLQQHYLLPDGPMSLYLSPNYYSLSASAHRRGAPPPPKLAANDIRRRTESFRLLANELTAFAMQIGAIPSTPEGQLQEFVAPLIEHLQDDKGKG